MTIPGYRVVSLGHRKKLLRAIGALASASGSLRPLPRRPRRRRARQLSVMFVDLIGSTALSARLDPEDMHEVIAAYRQCCASLIANGGFVAATWATACSPISATLRRTSTTPSGRCGRGLRSRKRRRSSRRPRTAPLQRPVGRRPGSSLLAIFSGREMRASRPSSARRRTGPRACNELAKPDEVSSPRTSEVVGDLFELDELGPQDSKSLGCRCAWTGCGKVPRRAGSTHCTRAGLAPLVGREQEFGFLLRCWRKGEGGTRPGRSALGRSGHRQVATDRGLSGTLQGGPIRAAALFLLARSMPTARSTRSSAR